MRYNPPDEDYRNLLRQAAAEQNPLLAYEAYGMAAKFGLLPNYVNQTHAAIAQTPYGRLYIEPKSATEVLITNHPADRAWSAPGDPFVVNRVALEIRVPYKLVPRDVWDYGPDGQGPAVRDMTLEWKRQWGGSGNRTIYRAGGNSWGPSNLSAAVSDKVDAVIKSVFENWLASGSGQAQAAEAVDAFRQIGKLQETIAQFEANILEAKADIGVQFLRMVQAERQADFSGSRALAHQFSPAPGRPPKDPSKTKCGICGKTQGKH